MSYSRALISQATHKVEVAIIYLKYSKIMAWYQCPRTYVRNISKSKSRKMMSQRRIEKEGVCKEKEKKKKKKKKKRRRKKV